MGMNKDNLKKIKYLNYTNEDYNKLHYKKRYHKYKKKYLLTKKIYLNNLNGGNYDFTEDDYIREIRGDIDLILSVYQYSFKLNTCEKKFYENIQKLQIRGQDKPEKFALLANDVNEIFKICKKEDNMKNSFMNYQ